MFSLMHVNLHEESKLMINSMVKPHMPRHRSQSSCIGTIVEEFHEALPHPAESTTLSELRRSFLAESAAQEVLVDLVGEYLDELVKSNDHCQVRSNPRVGHLLSA
jgi:hypothetical protein